MLAKIKKFSRKNSFLTNSSIVFLANITTGIFNYLIIIFASNFLLKEYSLWTAMTSFMTILIAPMTGIITEFVKNTSVLHHKSNQDAFDYYQFVKQKTKFIFTLALIFCVVSILFFWTNPDFVNFTIIGLIICYSLLNINANVNNHFLISTLSFIEYSIAIIVTTLARFLPTILFLVLGFGIFALPFGLLLSATINLFISHFMVRKFQQQNKLDNNKKATNFNIKKQLKAASFNILITFSLMLYFNVGPIISQFFFAEKEKDLFAVIYNFGQIIHFGSIAFLSTLVAYTSRGKSQKIYLSSVFVITLITFSIGTLFYLFSSQLLQILNRSQYLDQVPIVIFYLVFVAFFNIIFVSIQYLIGQSQYKKLIPFSGFVILVIFLSGLCAKGFLPFLGSPLISFINIYIIISIVCAVCLFYQVSSYNQKENN
jgi:O-antigen/teichoic acid export membrane protein